MRTRIVFYFNSWRSGLGPKLVLANILQVAIYSKFEGLSHVSDKNVGIEPYGRSLSSASSARFCSIRVGLTKAQHETR